MRLKTIGSTTLLLLGLGLLANQAWASTVTEDEAMNIAKGFVRFQGEQGGFTQWVGATVPKLEKIYSSNGIIMAYEAAVTTADGKSAGYVMVNARKGDGVAPVFAPEGEAITTELNNYYNGLLSTLEGLKTNLKLTKIAVTDHVILGKPPVAFALGVKVSNVEELAPYPDLVKFFDELPEQDGWYIFSDAPENLDQDYHYDETMEDPEARGLSGCESKALEDKLSEEDSFRQALAKQDYSGQAFTEEGSASVSKADDKGAEQTGGYFSPYGQENYPWTKGGTISGMCVAGCGPIAWAIVLDYWDRYGYSNLLPNGDDHYDYRDSTVRWMINELRGLLKTSCRSGNPGTLAGTSSRNLDRAIYFTQGRGYNFKSSTLSSNLWPNLITSVNNGWPAIALIDANEIKNGSYTPGYHNHYTVVYSYNDRYGTQGDYFCVKTGWRSTSSSCISAGNLSALTVIQPSN
jgi:hypothetical protein